MSIQRTIPSHILAAIKYMSDADLIEMLKLHGHVIWVIQAEQERRLDGQPCDNATPCANEDTGPKSEIGQPDDLLPTTPIV